MDTSRGYQELARAFQPKMYLGDSVGCLKTSSVEVEFDATRSKDLQGNLKLG